ncbi:hypothetical protein GN956_G18975 [Arapaima gigas]
MSCGGQNPAVLSVFTVELGGFWVTDLQACVEEQEGLTTKSTSQPPLTGSTQRSTLPLQLKIPPRFGADGSAGVGRASPAAGTPARGPADRCSWELEENRREAGCGPGAPGRVRRRSWEGDPDGGAWLLDPHVDLLLGFWIPL